MDERTQGALLLAVGGIAVRLGLTDAALAYVKGGLRPLLIVSGAVLVVLGLVAVVQAFRGGGVGETGAVTDALDLHGHASDGEGHQPGHGPAVAWLLTLPLLALLLIAPPPLGAFAAGRQSDQPLDASSASSQFPPLPEPRDGAVELSLSDYVYRALYDEQRSLQGQTVRLVGFVTATDANDAAFQLTRFSLACCAADGQAINVAVRADGPAPPVETWLEAEGRWLPREGHVVGEYSSRPPILEATAIRPIEQPADPYE